MKVKRQKRLHFRWVDVEKLLFKLGIQYEKRGIELYAKCPHPDHKDKDPSWHIRSDIGNDMNGVFHCWSCKWAGNPISLLRTLKGLVRNQAIEFLQVVQKQPIAEKKEISEKDYFRDLKPFEPSDIGFYWRDKPFKPVSIGFGSQCQKYLASRWIGLGYIERFGLLDWQERERVIVPITRNGKMISWVARSYNGASPKTLAPKGAPKRWELFGLDQADKTKPEANLAEGWADVIRLDQHSIVNPIGLNGSKLSEYQVESLLWADKITLWLDGDRVGRLLSYDAVQWFCKEIFIVAIPKGKDPASFKIGELDEFKPQRWENFRRDDEQASEVHG